MLKKSVDAGLMDKEIRKIMGIFTKTVEKLEALNVKAEQQRAANGEEIELLKTKIEVLRGSNTNLSLKKNDVSRIVGNLSNIIDGKNPEETADEELPEETADSNE